MELKALVFDSSTIITLALNNLLSVLAPLKRKFKGRFFVTSSIKKEIIDNPMRIKRFELEALMISNLLKEGVLEIYKEDLKEETGSFLDKANNIFEVNGEKIKLMHEGEASCLALYTALKNKGYKIALVIDERTTRMLCENPENLEKLFEKKLHADVLIKGNPQIFKSFEIIRSAELCFVAYKNKIINLPSTSIQAIDALLYAVKFQGCSISSEEIEKAKRLV